MENRIVCICRRYRVQTADGKVLDVDSDKPLSMQLNARLLEEEKEINEFFRYHDVKNMRQMVMSPAIKKRMEEAPKIQDDGTLTPRQRLNQLLKMNGVFTRNDYIKYLDETLHYKLNKWTSHKDINDALKLKKIELLEERKGKSSRKYRVIDPEEVPESVYKNLLEARKLQISTLT